eukprot:c24115_g1_i2 orf=285-845(+)
MEAGWGYLTCRPMSCVPSAVNINYYSLCMGFPGLPGSSTQYSLTSVRNNCRSSYCSFFKNDIVGQKGLGVIRFDSSRPRTTNKKILLTTVSSKPPSKPANVRILVFAFTVPLLLAGGAAFAGVLLCRRIEIDAMLEVEKMERLEAQELLDASRMDNAALIQEDCEGNNLNGQTAAAALHSCPKQEE